MNRTRWIIGALVLGMATLSSYGLELKAGFIGGANLSTFGGSDAKTLDDKAKSISNVGTVPSITEYPRSTGMTGGVRLLVEFNNMAALFTEFTFAEKANIWKGTVDSAKIIGGVTDTVQGTLEVVRRLNYFELPIYGAFKPHFGNFSPMLYVGPKFGFNCFASSQNKVDGSGATGDLKYLSYDSTTYDVQLFEAGISGGVGLSYTVGGYDLVFDVRYTQGLTSVIREKKIMTSSVAVMFGVMVPR